MAPPLLHLPARLKTLQTGAGRGRRWRCRWKWRYQKPHPGKVIERRKIPNDYEYYVHYTEFNRRLDERVQLEQLDLGTMETDLYEKVEDKVTSLKIRIIRNGRLMRHMLSMVMRSLMLLVYGYMRSLQKSKTLQT
ncbi:unnamed protein product [Musa acuminata subsp. burmannicoides]